MEPDSGKVIFAEYDEGSEVVRARARDPDTGAAQWTVTRHTEGSSLFDVRSVPGGVSVFMTGFPNPEYNYGNFGSFSLRPGVPADFQDWQERHFTSAEREAEEVEGLDGDPGGFGVRNLLRYALRLDPGQPQRENLPAARTVSIGINGDIENYLGLTFTRRPDTMDLKYIPEVSADLKEWIRVPEANIMRREENPDGTETVTFADWVPMEDAETNRRFMRLRMDSVE